MVIREGFYWYERKIRGVRKTCVKKKAYFLNQKPSV